MTLTKHTRTKFIKHGTLLASTLLCFQVLHAQNLLLNPGFESGTSSWSFFTNGAGSFTSSPPGFSSSTSSRITISTQGTNVQLHQSGLALQPNTDYTLTFAAYSNSGHDLALSIIKHTTPFTNYGLNNWVVNLTASWQIYTVQFTTTGSAGTGARLQFLFSAYDAAGDQYFIDDVDVRITSASPILPAITLQPSDQFVNTGQQATFSVTATGSPTLLYLWQKNNTDIPGATNPSYTTPATIPGDNGAAFRCIVTNSAGSDTSNAAILTVTSAPPPTANVISNGGFESGTVLWTFFTNGAGSFASVSPGLSGSKSARISITAQGTNVQLYQSNVILESNTNYTLTFSAYSATGHDIALYLHKQVSPFTNYGVNNTAFNLSTSSQTFTMEFSTTGFSGTTSDGRLRFWIAPYDAAGDMYFIDNVSLGKSNPDPPVITLHPIGQSVFEGETATFSVISSGNTPLAYQWQRDGLDIPGATEPSYTVPPVTLSDSGAVFRCVAVNTVGADTSDDALLSVSASAAFVTVNPTDKSVFVGETVIFAITARGSLPLSYQWQKNGADIEGATASQYTTPVTILPDSGVTFRCIVTNAHGSDTSSAAMLSVSLSIIVNVWYGHEQNFGQNGDPVPYINIPGNALADHGLASLRYSLNGGAFITLSHGPDSRRLSKKGDFNIDILHSALQAGQNLVVVRAADSIGAVLYDTIQVNYTAGNTWPVDHTVDWSTASSIEDVAQVVDGLWSLQSGEIQILKPGYDRLIAIGEENWNNYEVTVPITIHSIDSSGFAPPSNGPGIGLLLRWPGHSDSPSPNAGLQPKSGYLPLGAIAWYSLTGGQVRLRLEGNNLQLLAQQNRVLQHEVRYIFKARVETISGAGPRYSFKVWQDGLPEPAQWDLTGQETFSDPPNGCLLLVAHHFDASFGNVNIVSLDSGIPPSTIVSDNFNSPALNTGLWTFINPMGDATLTMTGTQLSIALPGGSPHDAWTGGNFSPRIMQAANNTDFEIEEKFQSTLNAAYQVQGLIVQQDSANYIRFDFVRENVKLRVFSASFINGSPTVRKDTAITAANTLYLRVRRDGNTWTQRYSYDGTTWYTSAVFAHSIAVASVGPFFGNAGSSVPPFTGLIDYFLNTSSPVLLPGRSAELHTADNLPDRFTLSQNYPNPFNPSTTISFALPELARVEMRIYDVLGREIITLLDEELRGGQHTRDWDGRNSNGVNVGSGVYLYRLVAYGVSGTVYTGRRTMMALK